MKRFSAASFFAGVLALASAFGLWAFAQDGPGASGQAPPPPLPAPDGQVAVPLPQPPSQDEIRRQAAIAAWQDEMNAARAPLLSIYEAIFNANIEGLLGHIDFNELILNGYYVGAEYQHATTTRRHDLEETLVRALSLGQINKQQLSLVQNTIQIAFDYTDRRFATFMFTNPAGRVTWGKVRKVPMDGKGENWRWVVYAING